ncbi:THO complex subunit 1 [Gracilariopsis chorda]|uniref:THO complex subunit 1 n=1 Tax=Gracilariopsis chorda TaxID=448386 RepID=A0A2V3J2I5_9FLOR|nr:THO complex subunit 1 [Gracilariopsis chorda]|eukprot:PXF47610.1 THO complex subunit 1 [Gracilariopsis chorda]
MTESDGKATNINPIEEYVKAKEALNKALTDRLKEDPSKVANELLKKFPKMNFQPSLLGVLVRILKSSSPFDALHVVDIATKLSIKGRVDQCAPITLMHYAFSFVTIDDIADNLEAIRQRIRAIPRAPLPQLFFIKLFKSVIERDIYGLHAERSGRLRVMLAESLRTWHPSGMNLRGTYGTRPVFHSPLPESHIDSALYNAIWGLQKFLQNPSLAEAESTWKEASVLLSTVLSVFETTPVNRDITPPGVEYSTSPHILEMQLADAHFRRELLVQYAIFLHHVETTGLLPVSSREKERGNQNAQFLRELFNHNNEGDRLKSRVMALLKRYDGWDLFYFLQSLLQRERVWVRWKKTSNYSNIKTATVSPSSIFKKRTVLWHQQHTSSSRKEWLKRIEALEGSSKDDDIFKAVYDRGPSPGLKELKLATHGDGAVEDSESKDGRNFNWRALRTLMDEDVGALKKLSSSPDHDLNTIFCKTSGNTEDESSTK